MQLITAIIRPFKVDDVKDALKQMGVHGITVTDVQGFGRQLGHTEVYRGAEYTLDFIPKAKLEVLCEDAETEAIVDAIVAAARTGAHRRRQDLGRAGRAHRPHPHRRIECRRPLSRRPLGRRPLRLTS